MKKRKLKKSTKKVIIVLLIAIIFGLGVYYVIDNFTAKTPVNTEIKVIDKIEDYGYNLEENETKLYKKLFKDLMKELNKEEIDYEKYAELISKLYIADFYNLENKITKNDVGGLQFIHSLAQENFLLKAKDTLYKNIQSNIYGDRNQELPVVKDISLDSIKEGSFKINDEELDSYIVTLKWTYEKDLDYDNSKEIILVKEDKKLSIVETNSL
ncbi:MAG: hypothetical protein E7166_06795 [Firmicutes bacterium]|nr:hypothetical protein [Bacillota bacterium]